MVGKKKEMRRYGKWVMGKKKRRRGVYCGKKSRGEKKEKKKLK